MWYRHHYGLDRPTIPQDILDAMSDLDEVKEELRAAAEDLIGIATAIYEELDGKTGRSVYCAVEGLSAPSRKEGGGPPHRLVTPAALKKLLRDFRSTCDDSDE